MNISHIIWSIDNSKGGPSRSVTHLLTMMAEKFPELQLRLHTAVSKNPIVKKFFSENVSLVFYTPKFMGRLTGLSKALSESETEIFHGQAIWDLPVHQMATVARKHKKPYLITPRGMLEPWSLRQSAFKKKLALKLYQYKDLKQATCLHATASMEAENLRALGFKNPIAIIPNGVPLGDFDIKDFRKDSENKKLLFLSRIHEKKGIELLIEAWSQLANELTANWRIDLIGNGELAYIEQIQRLIHDKGLSHVIHIKEPVYGAEKAQVYQNAHFFVLPSYSENFGIVVAEALACGTPVITTKGTPWQDLENHGCGWWIDIGVESLKNSLEIALKLPAEKRLSMGKNGRKLIEEKYSMEAVASQMHELYQWILGRVKKPVFVEVLN